MDIRLDTPGATLTGTTKSGNLGGDVVILPNGQLQLDNGLRTAIHLSLFVDRLAEPSDPISRELDEALPDRRGYWADFLLQQQVPGMRLGSRLWELRETGAVLTDETEARARDFCLEALAWLEQLGVGTVDVSTQRLAEPGNLLINIDVIDSLTGSRRRFSFLWDAMAREGV